MTAMGWESATAARLDPQVFAMLAVRRLRHGGASEDTILAFGRAMCALVHRPETPDAE
jgi:Xaa-Pro aminopeptidase